MLKVSRIKVKGAKDDFRPLYFSALALPIIYLFFTITRETISKLNSDTASFVVLAHQMLEQKTFFPTTFYYANGDILLSSNLTAALALFLGASDYQAIIIANLVNSSIFFLAVAFFASTLKAKKSVTILSFWVIGLGLSSKMIFFLFLQGSYLLVVVSTLVGISIYLRMTRTNSWQSKNLFFLFASQALLTMQNPFRVFVYFYVPLIVCEIYRSNTMNLSSAAQLFKKSYRKMLAVFACGALPPLVLHFYLVHYVVKTTKGIVDAYSIEPQFLGDNLQNLFVNFVIFFGGHPESISSLFSIGLMNSFIRLISLLFILYAFSFFRKTQDSEIKISLIFSAVSFAITLYLLSFTSLNNNVDSIRYFLPSFVVLLLISVKIFFSYFADFSLDIKLVSVVIVILFFLSQIVLDLKQEETRNTSFETFKNEFLMQENLTVYASFWNANLLSIDSNSTMRATPVVFNEESCIREYLWLAEPNLNFARENFWLLATKQESVFFKSSDSCSDYRSTVTFVVERAGYALFLIKRNN
jgi:hypothetical protein